MPTIDKDDLLAEITKYGEPEVWGGDEYAQGLLEQYRMDVATIKAAPVVNNWISVKDMLPERYERILTYDKYSGVRENWLLQSSPCVSWSYGFHVTHWMPMPEWPKEESK